MRPDDGTFEWADLAHMAARQRWLRLCELSAAMPLYSKDSLTLARKIDAAGQADDDAYALAQSRAIPEQRYPHWGFPLD